MQLFYYYLFTYSMRIYLTNISVTDNLIFISFQYCDIGYRR